MRALLLALGVTLLIDIVSVLVGLVDEADRWLRRRAQRPRRRS
jgi:hypothetical protein